MEILKPDSLSEEAFEEIYSTFWSKLYGLAYNYFRDKTTAEELVQDVFVHFWIKRNELSHVTDMRAYLFKSMKNRIYDEFDKIVVREKLIKNVTLKTNAEIHSTEETVAFEDTLALLNKEIAKLPPTTQTIFRLSRFDRYTNEEIASRLHVSAKAVEYHITVALKKLHIQVDHLIYFLVALYLFGW